MKKWVILHHKTVLLCNKTILMLRNGQIHCDAENYICYLHALIIECNIIFKKNVITNHGKSKYNNRYLSENSKSFARMSFFSCAHLASLVWCTRKKNSIQLRFSRFCVN